MRYMLDTNICIYALKNKPKEVLERIHAHEPGEVFVSSLTFAELMVGVEKSQSVEKNRLALTLLMAELEIINFDEVAAMEYGKVRANLERKGTVIGPIDMLIASHAKSLGYTIVTNNEKEFCRVDGLLVENWTR